MNALIHLPVLFGMLGLFCLFCLAVLFTQCKGSRAFKGVFCGLFIAGAFGFYHHYGATAGLVELKALETLKAEITQIAKQPDIPREEALIKFESIENKLGYSAFAMAQMANIYNQLTLHDKALASLEKAITLMPHEAEFQVQQVYIHSLINQGKLPPLFREKAQVLLQKDKSQFALLNLLAIDNYFQGHYEAAVAMWEQLLAQDPDLTNEKRRMIQSALHKAKSQLAHEGTLVDTAFFQIAVYIALNPDLRARLTGEETVFVFIKSPLEAMPLAVIKKSVRDCPFTVDFDSKHSMIASKPLTKGMQVEVVAKLSKTGDPLDKRGELLSKSQPFILNAVNKPISIEISS